MIHRMMLSSRSKDGFLAVFAHTAYTWTAPFRISGGFLTHSYMYVCMYVCKYVCMYVRTYVCMYVRMYVYMYVCMYVRMYLGTHVDFFFSILPMSTFPVFSLVLVSLI
jgi:hypothetical protein